MITPNPGKQFYGKFILDELLHEHPKRLRHGDAFFVPEIEVAVTPARFAPKERRRSTEFGP